MDEKKEKNARINFYVTPTQVKRMEELMELHGYANINQTAKFLYMRGLEIVSNLSGIIKTNENMDEMVELMRSEVAGLSSTATQSQVRDNTVEMSLDS
tara:strand:- start:489 stop:782 length:294 start_codon:yes stop_codon:yes gene_type:complete